MALRIKWLGMTGLDRKSIDVLLAGLIKAEYEEPKRSGFTNVVSRGKSIDAEYIERIESINKVEDPFGSVKEFPFVQYDRFFFSVSDRFPNLEIHNPTRTINSFLSQIGAILRFNVAIIPLDLDLDKWATEIQSESDSLTVVGAVAANVSLSNSVTAKYAFNGTTEVRPFVAMITGNSSYRLAKLQVSGILRTQRFKCDLFSDGRVTISDGVESEVSKMLRGSLRKLAVL